MKIHKILTILLCLFILIICSCERRPQIQPSGKTIKIGVIGPLTGNDQHKGEDGVKGIETTLHMYPLLDNGDAIELVIEDDRNDPEQSVKALRKLAEEDQVSAILIFSTSASVLAVNDIADQFRTPVLALLATHQDIAKNTSYVIQLPFDNIFQGMVAALYVMDELLIERAAVFNDPDSYHSTSLSDEFIRKYESLGGIVTDVIPVHEDMEITETILDVVQVNGADLLYLPISGKQVIETLKVSEKMGWYPKKLGSDGLLSNVRRQHSDPLNYLDGLLAIDLYTQQNTLTPLHEKAKKAYRKLHSDWASTYVAAGTEGMAVLIDAINRCDDSSNRECINTMLRSTKNFEGLMGIISIGPDGKAVRPLIVNTIKGGNMKFVVKVY